MHCMHDLGVGRVDSMRCGEWAHTSSLGHYDKARTQCSLPVYIIHNNCQYKPPRRLHSLYHTAMQIATIVQPHRVDWIGFDYNHH